MNERLPAVVPDRENVPLLFKEPETVAEAATLRPGMLRLPRKFWMEATPPTTWKVKAELLRLNRLSFKPTIPFQKNQGLPFVLSH